MFSSPAALCAAFGFPDGVGLDVQLLDKLQQSIWDRYSKEWGKGVGGQRGAFWSCPGVVRYANKLLLQSRVCSGTYITVLKHTCMCSVLADNACSVKDGSAAGGDATGATLAELHKFSISQVCVVGNCSCADIARKDEGLRMGLGLICGSTPLRCPQDDPAHCFSPPRAVNESHLLTC